MAVLPIPERKGWEVGLKELLLELFWGPLTVQEPPPGLAYGRWMG